MPNDSGRTISVWMSVSFPAFETLRENAVADVCVIGAGIAGLTTAYMLLREGKTVIIVDDGPVAGGETSRTTAHLASAQDDRFTELERLHGPDGARLAAQSHAAAIDRIEAIVAEERIDCEFTRLDGYLFVPPGESTDILNQELEAARRAGMADVELLPRAPLPSFDTGPCLRFGRQGQFHPLKYLAALVQRIVARGGRVCTQTHAATVEGGHPGRVTTTEGFAINADDIVVATNTPMLDRFALHTKQSPYRTYAVSLAVPKGSVPKGLYWDTADPYHYVRLTEGPEPEQELLIVGGEDHKTGQAGDADQRFERLEAWARERFSMAGKTLYRWSGQVMEPIDGLAFIGRNPMDDPNVYTVTGDSGQGMTHGTIAGMLLTDLILGRENPWATLYEPSRKSLRAAGEFARENINVARQYADWLTKGEVDSAEAIAPNAGAIIRRGLKKIAAYRDGEGRLHEFHAGCPHLGCIVVWNPVEHTWDCPCHGSRFDPEGRLLNGPANQGLVPVADYATADT